VSKAVGQRGRGDSPLVPPPGIGHHPARMTPTRKLIRWLPAIVWAAGISWLSSRQHLPEVGPEFAFKDKVGHWMLFCVLGALVAWALRRAHHLSLLKTFWLAILIASAYGVTDELHQRFVPNRTADVWDWATDTAGSAAAAAAFYVYESKRNKRTGGGEPHNQNR
jgi:VanZ family protein